MSRSIWLRRAPGLYNVERVDPKSPDAVEYVPASDYDELLGWIARDRRCNWSQNSDGVWDTTCGEVHEFMTGGPEANRHAFCPYCGNKLVPVDS